jgi:transcriptional regulator with XRE-family HTH domain
MTPTGFNARRLALGLSQAELAEMLDVKESLVLEWESGQTLIPESVNTEIEVLEDAAVELEERFIELFEHKSAVLDAAKIPFPLSTIESEASETLHAKTIRVSFARATIAVRQELDIRVEMS